MVRILAPAAALLLLAGCATARSGWTGSDAVPFDTADRLCAQDSATMADTTQRDEAFTLCMAQKGWTRTD